jgi:hypothetical protein
MPGFGLALLPLFQRLPVTRHLLFEKVKYAGVAPAMAAFIIVRTYRRNWPGVWLILFLRFFLQGFLPIKKAALLAAFFIAWHKFARVYSTVR